MSELGKWLAGKMKEREYTQGALAEYAGLSKSTVNEILNNKDYVPGYSILIKLATQFGVTPATLFKIAGIMGDESDRRPLHPKIQELLDVLDDLDLSSQAAVARAWEQNLHLALEMLEKERPGESGSAQ